MALSHQSRPGSRGGKDQFNWDTVKSDKDRECYLGHSLMAPTGRWQEGKDLTWYAKNRDQEKQIKSAEFLAAKRTEEEAMMAALGMRSMPPPAAAPPVPKSQPKPVIKREPQSVRIKHEPMTPAIHNDSRNSVRQQQQKKDDKRKEDRRRRRQLKAAASDEEKHDWSEDDIDDLIDQVDEEEEDYKVKLPLEQNVMTEKELDEFLVDLVKKHGLKTIQRTLKAKKDKKERKHKKPSTASASSSSSSDSEDEEEEKKPSKHKHHKKHSHKDGKKSSKRRRSSSPPPPPSSRSSTKDPSKHRQH